MKIEKLLKDYLDYLEIEKGRLVRTRENYRRYLETFFKFSNIKTEKDITLEKIKEFRLYLAREKTKKNEPLKKITQTYYLIALRNFLKFLIKNDYQVVSPEKIELPKVFKRQIDLIKYKELQRLLEAPKGNDLKTLRDKAILEVLFSTGLRLSELCALNRFIDIDQGEISIRGKGGKIRVVFLSEKAKDSLKRYLAKRTDPEEALFISLSKSKQPKVIGRITPRTVQRIIDYWRRKAGILEKVSPHQIRHWFATDLLLNGADLKSVQELLGHQNISTTQVYLHLTNPKLKEIHKKFHRRSIK